MDVLVAAAQADSEADSPAARVSPTPAAAASPAGASPAAKPAAEAGQEHHGLHDQPLGVQAAAASPLAAAAGRQRQQRGGAMAAETGQAAAAEPRQGAKRKRGAPPEDCPFCGHSYTVRDGLSTHQDAAGNRLHLRRCQCRKKAPPCRNCPQCKHRRDVMQQPDEAAAFELCQRLYACAICACKCPAVGKWVESEEESRQVFRERTQRRQEELTQLGWQDTSHAAQPASTYGTASAASLGAEGGDESDLPAGQQQQQQGEEAAEDGEEQGPAGQRPKRRRPQQQQPSRSGLSSRRLPADIRRELEQLQSSQGHGLGQRQGQGASKGRPSAAATTTAAGAAAGAAGAAASHRRVSQQQQQQPACEHEHAHAHTHGHKHGQAQGHGKSGGHQHQNHHLHSHHHHTCAHPHEDCTSECCSAPTAVVPTGGTAAAAAAEALAAAAAAAAAGAGLGPLPAELLPAGADSGRLLQQLWSQLAAAAFPGLAPGQAGPLPALPPAQPVASAPPELPAEVTELVQEVFAHAAGQQMADAVAAFLRRQRLTSLGDLEFLELAWLQQELGPLGLPPLLLNKFLVLGRRRSGVATAAAADGPRT